MSDRHVGQLLDSLNVTLDLTDDDMVTDVILIAKVVAGDGAVNLGLGKSESTSWLEQLGLVYAAGDIIRQGEYHPPEQHGLEDD